MTECPSCGYIPEVESKSVDYDVLWRKRIRDIFGAHLMKSWWVSQPRWVCGWLKQYATPKSILDVGCGDGRWYPALSEAFPEAQYTGIDGIPEHIDANKEAMPNVRWLRGDFCQMPHENFDLLILAGVFNPIMADAAQVAITSAAARMSPKHILSTFDRNESGNPPRFEAYKIIAETSIPREEQGPRQDVVAWLFKHD